MSIDLIYKDKKFWPLFWTQFFGALNDNYFKNALVMLVAYKGIVLWGMDDKQLVAFASGIFILPFFLFSSMAGQIADKFEKSHLIKAVKWAELAIMLIAAFAFYSHHYAILMISLFLMGLHSTVFGPIKYSIIPELVREEQLVSGNAYVEVGTFMAILIGTICGGVVVSLPGSEMYLIAGLLFLSVCGIVTSQFVPKVIVADPNLILEKNPFPQMLKTTKLAYPNKAVFNSILGISWFWFLGAAILSVLPILTKNVLSGGEHVVTAFLAVFVIGIAAGSIVCEKLSFNRVEIGLVPFGSLGMTLFLVDMAFSSSQWSAQPSSLLSLEEFLNTPGSFRIVLDLFGIAFSGGLFNVPLYTLIQERTPREIRSRIVAGNNILNSLFMVVSSVLLMWFYAIKLTIPQIFLIYGAFNLIVAVYIYHLVPEFTLRFLAWILARMIYRIRVEGHSNIPKEGAAILVCNHVTFIDWLILSAGIKRPISFVMYYKFFNIPLVRYLFKNANVIPIAGKNEDPVIFAKAFDTVSTRLRSGGLVCIFPEGGLTDDGQMKIFRKGIEHIIARDPVPVVPVALKGIWGSVFSRKGGKALGHLPRRIWFPVWIKIGSSIPPHSANAPLLEQKVRTLLN